MFFTIHGGLSADSRQTGFRKGGYYFEYRYGLAFLHSGSAVGSIYDNNDLPVSAVSNADDAAVFFYSRSDGNRPNISSTPHSILLEYGLTDKLGIGFDLHTEFLQASNFSTSNYNQNLLYSAILYGSDFSNPLVLSDINKRYIALKEKANLLNILSLDFNVAYHFSPGKKWDPYARAGFGLGKDLYSNNLVTRLVGSIGTRYFVSKQFYLLGEFQLAHQEIIQQSQQGLLASYTPNGHLREAYVQVGLGYSPDFSRKKKKPKKKESKPPVKEELKPPIQEKKQPSVKEEIKPPVTEETPKTNTLVPELQRVARENSLLLQEKDGKLFVISANAGLFESGSDRINSTGKRSFTNLARVLAKLQDVQFTITGHTDSSARVELAN
ncbi:MAG: hypothetical protein AAF518_28925, partial [Spirochaetota bacterium]